MKRKYASISFLLLILIAICFYACSKSGNNPTDTTTGNKVTIANFAFSSSSLKVPAGTTVIWTNNDNTTHTVTADDGSFTSGDLVKGATYSITFTKTGTYPYHCKFHSMMVANVIVQ
ncbi:MAG: cupredoxin domain-containing protein [Chitinophagaceae bacterium]